MFQRLVFSTFSLFDCGPAPAQHYAPRTYNQMKREAPAWAPAWSESGRPSCRAEGDGPGRPDRTKRRGLGALGPLRTEPGPARGCLGGLGRLMTPGLGI